MTKESIVSHQAMTPFLRDFRQNIASKVVQGDLSKQITAKKLEVLNNQKFREHLNLLIPYSYYEPSRILAKLADRIESSSLKRIIEAVYSKTCDASNLQESVWKGNLGEIIAAGYIVACTEYEIPDWKLRYSTNRASSMPGEDVIAFQWNRDGTPKSLLILEAKNYLQQVKSAVNKAREALLKAKEVAIIKLLDFTINRCYEKGQVQKAQSIEQFLNEYDHSHKKKYLAFIVTDAGLWQDRYFANSQPELSLEIIAFLIKDWQEQQQMLVSGSNQNLVSLDNPTSNVKNRDEVPDLLGNFNFQKDQKKLSSAVLLFNFDIQGEYPFVSKINIEKMRNAAKSVSYQAIHLLENGNERGRHNAKLAAAIFENLSNFHLENDEKLLAVKYIIESAFLYSIAGYNANARVLAVFLNRSLAQAARELLPAIPMLEFLLCLILGDFLKLNNALAKFLYNFNRNAESQALAISDAENLELIRGTVDKCGDYFMAKAFLAATDFLKSGHQKFEEYFGKNLAKAQEQFESIGAYDKYNYTFIIKYYLKYLINHSAQKWLRKYYSYPDSRWSDYINHISTVGKFPLITLWKSQQKALEGRLLGTSSIFVSMPTSAGKTRMAEFALVKNYFENHGQKAVFIVPTRALAAEVERDLSVNLKQMTIRTAIIYGGYDFSATDEVDIDNNDIFVLTPEKFDFLLRNADGFQNRISLIILDEVQEAAQHNIRGLRIEFIFSRIMHLADKLQIRVIALSAVIKNVADFSKWIGKSEDNHIRIDWKPVNKRFAFFEIGPFGKPRIEYTVSGGDAPTEAFYIPLELQKKQIVNDRGRRDYTKIAAALSSFYAKHGVTLVFTTQKAFVETIVRKIIEITPELEFESQSDDFKKLIEYCARILPAHHLLISSLQCGVCYHHGGLPVAIRKEIENALRKKIIHMVVSTTTLAQGVNLPLKNVIIHSLRLGEKYISSAQYMNIIGRAGRAGRETEGHIIFCNKMDWDYIKNQSEDSKSFIISGLEWLLQTRFPSIKNKENVLEKFALASTQQYYQASYIKKKFGKKAFQNLLNNAQDNKVKKQLNDYYTLNTRGTHYVLKKDSTASEKECIEAALANTGYDFGARKVKNAQIAQAEILGCFDAQLIAWLTEAAIEEISDEAIEDIFGNLLTGVQEIADVAIFEKFKLAVRARASNILNNNSSHEVRKLFYRTGLSCKSNEQLFDFIRSIAEGIANDAEQSSLSADAWEKIFECLSGLSEFNIISKAHISYFLNWLDGKEYNDIAETHNACTIEVVVKKIEEITYCLPWGLSAIYQNLQYQLEEQDIPAIFYHLPSMVTYGVPNIIAVYAMKYGFDDREVATVFGKIHSGSIVDYGSFVAAMQGDFDEQTWYQKFRGANVAKTKLASVYNRLQTKLQNVYRAKESEFTLHLAGGRPADLTQETLEIVEIEGLIHLASLGQDYFWKLSGEGIEKLAALIKRGRLLAIEDLSFESMTVRIRVI